MKTFSETINIDPVEPIPVAVGPVDFEDKVYRVLIQMRELGYEPTIIQVRDFIRKIRKSGDLAEFIKRITTSNTPFSEKINTGIDAKQWKKLLEDIERWKKTGGTLKAKLKGKPGKETRQRIEELIAQQGPKLTSEEMDEIAATPGVIPPWWSKDTKYFMGAIKAIRKLGVSALDVHIAVERDYTDKPLSKVQKEILKVGWGGKMTKSFSESIKIETFATLSERRAYLMRDVGSRMRDQLNYYLNTEHTIYKIQAKTGVKFDKWETEDYNDRRKLYILTFLNSHLKRRLDTPDLPPASTLKNETYKLIRQADTDFQLEVPPESYKLEAPWAVREKREEERRKKEILRRAKEEKTTLEKMQKYEIERLLRQDMTPLEIVDQLWIDYKWDKEEMLYMAKRILAKLPEEVRRKTKEKKAMKDLTIKTGIGEIEGLSEKNIIPLGNYYHPKVGWY